jgi:hypothetical protein
VGEVMLCILSTYSKRKLVSLFATSIKKFRRTRYERSSKAPVLLYSLSFEWQEI